MEAFEGNLITGKMKRHKNVRPPRLADRLLEWYCANASMEDLHGDLEELFYRDLEKMPARRAKLEYWRYTLSLMLSYAVKRRKHHASFHALSSTTVINPAMLKNYFVIATRNLAKHKFFTVINVLGMSIGMSISLLLIAMLSFLWSYDEFHTNNEHIYRVITRVDNHERNREYALAPPILAEKLKSEYPGIEETVRVNKTLSSEAIYGDKKIPLAGYFVDPSFLDVFTFPLMKGNAATALVKPHTMVITEKAAVRMFGESDPVGKVITMGEWGDIEITGVLKDHPKNSHLQFEVLASYETLLRQDTDRLADTRNIEDEFQYSYLYLLLPEQADPAGVENYLNALSATRYTKKEEKLSATFELQALRDIAPGRSLYRQIGPDWDYTSISIFLVLTLLILLPACFNYANISISRALKRMKEIGLRKTMGGQQRQIFVQFVTETVIISFLALALSYYFFTLIRPEFLALIVGSEALDLTTDLRMILCFVAFALVVGVGAGFVPALYFSRLNPVQALKGQSSQKRKSSFAFRKILVVSQFAMSLGFIMSVVIVLNQYRHTMDYDFGFTQENILDVELQGTDVAVFRNEFSRLASVETLSMSSHILGASASSSTWVKEADATDSVEVFQMYADHNYLANLGLSLLAGKNFPDDPADASRLVIVNEEFLKTFRISDPAAAVGRAFTLENGENVIVNGVLKNFHYMDLREPIRSFFFRYDTSQFVFANLKIVPTTDMFNTITSMEAVWKTFAGEKKFRAKFFDDEVEEAYSVYFSMIKICGFLGLLAISISCLGLLGMVVFTVENRVKEVGIRKVMGASSGSLTLLLSRDFIKLMLIAAMIAVPLTYLFFDQVYLRMHYYNHPIGVGDIFVSLFLMLVPGLATILSQTVKASKANPVDILRSE
jgi:ABC-type antimicrobial peptide transport system permease subunit